MHMSTDKVQFFMTIADRFKEERLRLDLTQTAAAELVGKGKTTIINWEKSNGAPDAVELFELSKHGFDVTYITTGQRMLVAQTNIPFSTHESHETLNEDQINLPCLNIKGSAGPGNEVLEERVIGHFQVSRSWVRNVLNCEPGKVDVIFVDGPSMEPTLLDGELVLVDRRCHRFDNDAVYVIQYDGHLRIKRVQLKFDGGVIIKSDNPRFEPEMLTQDQAEHLRVIGKVLPWKFGQFKL